MILRRHMRHKIVEINDIHHHVCVRRPHLGDCEAKEDW